MMKMKKLHIYPAAAAIMLLAAGCGAPADSTAPSDTAAAVTESIPEETTVSETSQTAEPEQTTAPETTTTEQTTELPFEDIPENAYKRMEIAFSANSDDGRYPDDFAGSYSFFGKLYVALTTDEPSELYTDLLSDYTCIKYTTVTHSFNELTDVCNKAMDVFDGTEYKVVNCYVDVPSNKACLILEERSLDAKHYLRELTELSFDRSLLEITDEEELSEE